MIKIETQNLEEIALNYFDKVKDSIMLRSGYLVSVQNVLSGILPFDVLVNHPLHGALKKSLVNILLSQNTLKDQKSFANVIPGNCHPWVTQNQQVLLNIAQYLNNETNLKKLILCGPRDALTQESKIKAALGITPANWTSEIKQYISSLIDYNIFDGISYSIAKDLGVNTCPYCNRNYINTVFDKNGSGVIRATFDHFFPQKLNPFLGLSFYNLIPSCYYCNSSLKHMSEMRLDTHVHPYLEGFENDCVFHVIIIGCKPNKSDPENYSLSFKDNMLEFSVNDRYKRIFGGTRSTPNDDEGNINLFALKEIYKSHLDIVGEIRVKCDALSTAYSDSLYKMFGLLNTNKTEFYQYYFGNYLTRKDFHKRPMSKLHNDLISQMIPNFMEEAKK